MQNLSSLHVNNKKEENKQLQCKNMGVGFGPPPLFSQNVLPITLYQ